VIKLDERSAMQVLVEEEGRIELFQSSVISLDQFGDQFVPFGYRVIYVQRKLRLDNLWCVLVYAGAQ
jgi:hypothetical protein